MNLKKMVQMMSKPKYFLIVLVHVPNLLKTIGKSFGPITNIAIITTINSSNHPICGIKINFY